jgi:IS605 OrfB family transposase
LFDLLLHVCYYFSMDVTRTAIFELHNTFPSEMKATMELYQQMVEALMLIARDEWEVLVLFTGNNQQGALEDMVISTAPRKIRGDEDGKLTEGNKAKYPGFEQQFKNIPSYLRRAAITAALGDVASHMTRWRKWKDKQAAIVTGEFTDRQKKQRLDKLGRPPTFNAKNHRCPVLFKGNARKQFLCANKGKAVKHRVAGLKTTPGAMVNWCSAEHAVVKLYNGAAWDWRCVRIKQPKKSKYTVENGWVEGAVTLVPSCGSFRFHVAVEKKVLFKAKTADGCIISVDLGLNTQAVAVALDSQGTIHGRHFIDCPETSGLLKHMLGTIACKYRLSGQPSDTPMCRQEWAKVANLADEIAHYVSAELIKVAQDYEAKVICFEHLGNMKLPRDTYGAKRMRKKWHYWMQARIQKYTKQKAHALGIRVSFVLARGTSAEAFNGSGPVKRSGNCKIAKFQDGTTYDADLSAAYNIGARYWIRLYHDLYPKARETAPDATQDAVSNQKVPKKVRAATRRAVSSTSVTPEEAKARCESTDVTGQGTACPADATDVIYVTGVPVARHRQTLASFIRLLSWVDTHGVNTRATRIHARVKSLHDSKATCG